MEEFSSHLAVLLSIRAYLEMLNSLAFIDKSAEHDHLFSHSYSVGLNSFSQIFVALSDQITCWRIILKLFYKVLEQTFITNIAKLFYYPQNSLFWFSRHLNSLLYTSDK